jgi:hypothetical protein
LGEFLKKIRLDFEKQFIWTPQALNLTTKKSQGTTICLEHLAATIGA